MKYCKNCIHFKVCIMYSQVLSKASAGKYNPSIETLQNEEADNCIHYFDGINSIEQELKECLKKS